MTSERARTREDSLAAARRRAVERIGLLLSVLGLQASLLAEERCGSDGALDDVDNVAELVFDDVDGPGDELLDASQDAAAGLLLRRDVFEGAKSARRT